MRSSVSAFVVVLVVALAVTALAPPARAGGSIPAGKARSTACQACHTPDGDFPELAGQKQAYLAKQLAAFKKGDRKSGPMNAIASQLSDADIADLAAFWNGQPAGSGPTDAAAVAKIRTSHMAFPAAFPKGFVLYRSSNDADQKLVQKSYANAIALDAARAGTPLPSGAVILTVTSTTKQDAKHQPIAGADGAWIADQVKSYGGMEARTGWGSDLPELLRNDDWNYGVFGADKHPHTDVNQAICLACHKPAAKDSYVFTSADLVAKAKATAK